MRIRRLIPWLAALLPPAFLTIVTFRYYVPVPFSDEWMVALLLEKFYQGRLTFFDLWKQVCDHRFVFPRILEIGLARLTSWNHYAQILMNLSFAFLTFFVVSLPLVKFCWDSKDDRPLWVLLPFSLTVFSLRQYELWLWGDGICFITCILCAMAATAALSQKVFRWSFFWCAAILSIISTYSLAAGLICWPVGFILLSLTEFTKKETKISALLAWGAIFLAVSASYFYSFGFGQPCFTPSLFYAWEHPSKAFFRFFSYLGALLSETERKARFFGLMGFLWFSILTVFLFYRRNRYQKEFLPYLGFGLFSIGGGIMIVIGRTPVWASRYTTLSYPFWISILGMTVFFLKSVAGKYARYLGIFALGGITFSIFSASVSSQYHFRWYKEKIEPARRELFTLKDKELDKKLFCHWGEEFLKERVKFLREHKLSVFRGAP